MSVPAQRAWKRQHVEEVLTRTGNITGSDMRPVNEVFGTQDDRAVWARVEEAIELIAEQPAPAEAVRRIPPATRHAVDTEPIRRAAAWLIEFSNLYEQETRNGNEASE